MNAAFALMFLQVMMGGFDSLWHHELVARLPQRASARKELALHSAREAIYAVLFAGFAWLEFHGPWVLLPATLLITEVFITCADFLEEDRTRKLPPFERVLHTWLAVSYGVLLGFFAPLFAQWWMRPGGLVGVNHGIASWFFTLVSLLLVAWSLRNAIAARQLTAQVEATNYVAVPRGPAVLVTGATGFIGSALVRSLLQDGRRVIVFSRDPVQARQLFGERVWAVDRLDDIPAETRIEAVVHLAGAPVIGLPWTARRREVLMASRTRTMQEVLALMRRLEQAPRVLVSASAVGFYGVPEGDALLDERAPAQPGRFQSDLCAAVEHEARRAACLGARVVRLRFGLVFGHGGGSYPALAMAARLGLGAVLGGGRQPVPWIHLDDAVGLVRFALRTEGLEGAVNAVAPEGVTQARFAQSLAEGFGSRACLRVPGRVLRTMLGEMSELLLCGQNVQPAAALAAGYRFRHASLRDALAELRAPGSRGSR